MMHNWWCIFVVVQCKIIGYVGIHGIMVRETKETFGIITQENKFQGDAYIFKMYLSLALPVIGSNSFWQC